MEIIIILVIITLVFSITIGLIIMTRDEVPDVLVEEVNDALDDRREELEEDDEVNKEILENEIEVTITNNEEEDKDQEENVDDEEVI